jgi:hypothetical protein
MILGFWKSIAKQDFLQNIAKFNLFPANLAKDEK